MTSTKQQLLENCKYIKQLIEHDQLDIATFLNETILDIEYTLTQDKTLLGAKLLVAFGGPTIYINTRYSKIEGYWSSDQVTIPYSNDELDDYLIETFCL